MKKVLVLCTGNSCRSQIAEGYLRHFSTSDTLILSAGTEIHGVNPRAIAVMKSDGIDISKHTSNHVSEYDDISFNIIITVCDHAKENCPFVPGKALRIHQNFPDPAKANGSEAEIIKEFSRVRDLIKVFSERFAKTYLQ